MKKVERTYWHKPWVHWEDSLIIPLSQFCYNAEELKECLIKLIVFKNDTVHEALKPSKNTRGRPKTTYLQVIKTQFKENHFQTLEDAMMKAKDRERSRAVIQNPSIFADKGQQ